MKPARPTLGVRTHSKWGPKTPKPETDPRAALRHLEGQRVGVYDVTTLPLEVLREAMTTGVVRIIGDPRTHTISPAFAAEVVKMREEASLAHLA